MVGKSAEACRGARSINDDSNSMLRGLYNNREAKLAISATQATAGAGTQKQNKKGCLTVEKLATCNSSSMDPRNRR